MIARLARLSIVGAVFTAAYAFVVWVCLIPAFGHDAPAGWSYPTRCCWGPASGRTGDCGMIPAESVKVGPEGYIISLVPGDHEMVKKPITIVVPYADAMQSPDGEYHICFTHSMTVRCFFAGGRFG